MTTWTELECPASAPETRTETRRSALTFAEHWRWFHDRRGTGGQTFAQRLARARLLYLRRDENGSNWLALSLLAGMVSLPLLFHVAWPESTANCGSGASLRGDSCRGTANPLAFFESTPYSR